MSKQLSDVMDEARKCIRAADDPRNWPNPGLIALKLLVAFIEDKT